MSYNELLQGPVVLTSLPQRAEGRVVCPSNKVTKKETFKAQLKEGKFILAHSVRAICHHRDIMAADVCGRWS